MVGVGQYIFPVAVLWKIRASFKSWLYLFLYPLFIYSWIPITALGWWNRHDHEWSHTLHTRGISFDDVIVPEDAVNDGPKEVVFAKKKNNLIAIAVVLAGAAAIFFCRGKVI